MLRQITNKQIKGGQTNKQTRYPAIPILCTMHDTTIHTDHTSNSQ